MKEQAQLVLVVTGTLAELNLRVKTLRSIKGHTPVSPTRLWQAFSTLCLRSWPGLLPPCAALKPRQGHFQPRSLILRASFLKHLQKKWPVLLTTLSGFISRLPHCLSRLALFFPSAFPLLFILKILSACCFFKAASATFIVLPIVQLLSPCSAFDTKLHDQLISLAHLSGCWHWAPSSFCFPVLFLYHSATCVFLWGHP